MLGFYGKFAQIIQRMQQEVSYATLFYVVIIGLIAYMLVTVPKKKKLKQSRNLHPDGSNKDDNPFSIPPQNPNYRKMVKPRCPYFIHDERQLNHHLKKHEGYENHGQERYQCLSEQAKKMSPIERDIQLQRERIANQALKNDYRKYLIERSQEREYKYPRQNDKQFQKLTTRQRQQFFNQALGIMTGMGSQWAENMVNRLSQPSRSPQTANNYFAEQTYVQQPTNFQYNWNVGSNWNYQQPHYCSQIWYVPDINHHQMNASSVNNNNLPENKPEGDALNLGNSFQQNPAQQNPFQQNPSQQNPFQQNSFQQNSFQQNPFQTEQSRSQARQMERKQELERKQKQQKSKAAKKDGDSKKNAVRKYFPPRKMDEQSQDNLSSYEKKRREHLKKLDPYGLRQERSKSKFQTPNFKKKQKSTEMQAEVDRSPGLQAPVLKLQKPQQTQNQNINQQTDGTNQQPFSQRPADRQPSKFEQAIIDSERQRQRMREATRLAQQNSDNSLSSSGFGRHGTSVPQSDQSHQCSQQQPSSANLHQPSQFSQQPQYQPPSYQAQQYQQQYQPQNQQYQPQPYQHNQMPPQQQYQPLQFQPAEQFEAAQPPQQNPQFQRFLQEQPQNALSQNQQAANQYQQASQANQGHQNIQQNQFPPQNGIQNGMSDRMQDENEPASLPEIDAPEESSFSNKCQYHTALLRYLRRLEQDVLAAVERNTQLFRQNTMEQAAFQAFSSRANRIQKYIRRTVRMVMNAQN